MVEAFGARLLTAYNAELERRNKPVRPDIAFGDQLANQDRLQPFTLVARVWFGPPPTLLRVHYQFDTTYRGYIVAVSEKQAGPAVKAEMNTDRTGPAPPGQYSNVHDFDRTAPSTESLMDMVDAPHAPGAQPWDAMTKIAGEAPRFQCVRRAAQARMLSDALIFHHGQLGIRFGHLWQTWTEFGNKYGITDNEVKTKLAEWNNYDPATASGKNERNRQQRLKDFVSKRTGGHNGHPL